MLETVKLYHDTPARYSGRATVLACEKNGESYDIVLDRTLFYPEGGGQPSDKGSIGEATVSHVREKDGVVYHSADRELKLGSSVDMQVDAVRRLDLTQQHTGEHIISGVALKLFNARNVGIHIAEDYSTADLDTYLEPEQIIELERVANQAVYDNIPVVTDTIGREQAERFPLRKSIAAIEGRIRVVTMANVDCCACCGTHCDMTGGVGAIKITAAERYKGGIRLHYACGGRALEDHIAAKQTVDALAKRFSVKESDVTGAVIKQSDELNAARRELKLRTGRLLDYLAAELMQKAQKVSGTSIVTYADRELSAAELKELAEKLCAKEKAVALMFALGREDVKYVFIRSKDAKLSMKDVCAAANAILNGKGGGREDFAQGSAPARKGFEESLEQLGAYVGNVLR